MGEFYPHIPMALDTMTTTQQTGEDIYPQHVQSTSGYLLGLQSTGTYSPTIGETMKRRRLEIERNAAPLGCAAPSLKPARSHGWEWVLKNMTGRVKGTYCTRRLFQGADHWFGITRSCGTVVLSRCLCHGSHRVHAGTWCWKLNLNFSCINHSPKRYGSKPGPHQPHTLWQRTKKGFKLGAVRGKVR